MKKLSETEKPLKKLSDEKMSDITRAIAELKKRVSKEKKIVGEMNTMYNDLEKVYSLEERNMINSHILELQNSLKKTEKTINKILMQETHIMKPLPSNETGKKVEFLGVPPDGTSPKNFWKGSEEKKVEMKKLPSAKKEIKEKGVEIPISSEIKKKIFKTPQEKVEVSKKLMRKISSKGMGISDLERTTLKKFKEKGKRIIYKRNKKPSNYVRIASKMFSKVSNSLLNTAPFKTLEKELIRANLQFISTNYLSVMLLTTLISFIVGFFVFLFFSFFSISSENPIISMVKENLLIRMIQMLWILVLFPLSTFLFMYFYPSMERKSIETKINQELPFATIHMSAISGSLVEPSKIFKIIINTREYPALEKEFTKLMNEINVYGYDLVTAMKNVAVYSPSEKLADLFNGIATTITSGGDLPEFFNKRSETLLFDYKLQREKYNKTVETFMDIYISVVIAAPMILMLLLMMMKISGLGITLSTNMITLVMVIAVSVINLIFMAFLHLKQPNG
ncbi:MAG: type II secretion system F family protein [Nanoarchaeota archaeon]